MPFPKILRVCVYLEEPIRSLFELFMKLFSLVYFRLQVVTETKYVFA